ncbi:phospholipase D-like domain-containing protein [Rufibacter sp. DG15C]|uniref:phospholipase D-like domain-containing protein n=1 Tax=Rufibacter sp. DG15C TaxID=1379909 RepID=UPI000837020E|nr:phospholipase D-like domain-containing protein [Rufibacter sp. DG15C]
MKILQPHRISTEILDIIYEAKQYLIIVSPYVNFKYWESIASALSNANKRGVRIDFFVRNEPDNSASWEQVESLGIIPRLVSNLHAKFYFNEKNGVISSMNLLSSSNSNSIEIGCKLETMEELDELKRFVKDYVTTNEVKEKPSEDDLYVSKEKFLTVLENYLSNDTKSRSSAYFKNGAIHIKACSNSITMTMDKVKNKVYLDAILSQDEAEMYNSEQSKYLTPGYFVYQFNKGGNGYHNTVGAWSQARLSNSYLENLRVEEKKQLIYEISEFVKNVTKLKDACYAAYKASKAKPSLEINPIKISSED